MAGTRWQEDLDAGPGAAGWLRAADGAQGFGLGEAAAAVARKSGVPIEVIEVSDQSAVRDVDQNWRHLRAVSADGAILVRPDQHVGWRSVGASDNAQAILAAALAKILQKDVIPAQAGIQSV